MPIPLATLSRASAEAWRETAASTADARAKGLRTAFLCHSHVDQAYVAGLVVMLGKAGWNVYVDWRDPAMPSRPTRETAARIKDRILGANYFLFLATPNSMASRWCPWEIGYADGVKPIDSILVIPTHANGLEQGSEYLGLYRRIDLSSDGRLAVWAPGQTTGGTWLRSV